MIVTFYCRNEQAETETVGTIELRDGHLIPDPPDSVLLKNVLDDEVWIDRGADPPLILNATHHPEAFFHALPKQYGHGSYFWCTRIEG